MDLGEAVIVAGIGCRSHIDARDIEAAIEAALRQWQVSAEWLTLIAIPVRKAGEPGIFAAAAARGVGLVLIPQSALEAAGQRTLTRSIRSLSTMNVHSVAEASALAGAGATARLLGPRIATGSVTCALANTEGLP